VTHDNVKEAARKRMAETGEPYALARRMVIQERNRDREAAAQPPPADAPWSRPDATILDDLRQVERDDRERTSRPFD
jgi:hypothetical protein